MFPPDPSRPRFEWISDPHPVGRDDGPQDHLSDRGKESDPTEESDQHPPGGRKFLGVKYRCCSVYGRLYMNRDETAYCGRCPRCARPVRINISEGGTSSRFFSV